MPAALPKLHTLAQAMLRCRGSHVFKVAPYELVTPVTSQGHLWLMLSVLLVDTGYAAYQKCMLG